MTKKLKKPKKCKHCGRPSKPSPIPPERAAKNRLIMILALGEERGEILSFAWARSTVIVSTTNKDRVCKCDLKNWHDACEEYEDDGKAAWLKLGVTPELMAQADAERVAELEKEARSREPDPEAN